MAKKSKTPTIENRVKSGYIDLTKTGPLSYSELRALNSNLPKEVHSTQNDLPGTTMVLGDIGRVNWVPDTGLGESMFDPGIASADEVRHLQDIRANKQPWYAQWGAGLLKNMGLASTTFLDETVGLAYGIGQGISNLADDDPNTGFW